MDLEAPGSLQTRHPQKQVRRRRDKQALQVSGIRDKQERQVGGIRDKRSGGKSCLEAAPNSRREGAKASCGVSAENRLPTLHFEILTGNVDRGEPNKQNPDSVSEVLGKDEPLRKAIFLDRVHPCQKSGNLSVLAGFEALAIGRINTISLTSVDYVTCRLRVTGTYLRVQLELKQTRACENDTCGAHSPKVLSRRRLMPRMMPGSRAGRGAIGAAAAEIALGADERAGGVHGEERLGRRLLGVRSELLGVSRGLARTSESGTYCSTKLRNSSPSSRSCSRTSGAMTIEAIAAAASSR